MSGLEKPLSNIDDKAEEIKPCFCYFSGDVFSICQHPLKKRITERISFFGSIVVFGVSPSLSHLELIVNVVLIKEYEDIKEQTLVPRRLRYKYYLRHLISNLDKEKIEDQLEYSLFNEGMHATARTRILIGEGLQLSLRNNKELKAQISSQEHVILALRVELEARDLKVQRDKALADLKDQEDRLALNSKLTT
ncbi:hypothetical protein HAX54_024158 [Datura stramonium]|uniref:Uncharacterized protein n=1 Tax=Datura stramonium TaxID=4076 RepID=A0ABS8S571_DATST|nr:hypothetical protein [Datura stramonium]